jgi:hypothetical protein
LNDAQHSRRACLPGLALDFADATSAAAFIVHDDDFSDAAKRPKTVWVPPQRTPPTRCHTRGELLRPRQGPTHVHTHSVPLRAFRVRYSLSAVAVSEVTHASDFHFSHSLLGCVRRGATRAENVSAEIRFRYDIGFWVDIALPQHDV